MVLWNLYGRVCVVVGYGVKHVSYLCWWIKKLRTEKEFIAWRLVNDSNNSNTPRENHSCLPLPLLNPTIPTDDLRLRARKETEIPATKQALKSKKVVQEKPHLLQLVALL